MTAPTRSLPSLVAALTVTALALLGCSSSPTAAPSTAAPSTAAPSSSPPVSAPVSDSASVSASVATTGSGTADPGSSEVGPTGESSTAGPSTGEPSEPVGSGSTGGPAKIQVSGAICEFLEKKIPVAEMATLSGLAVDRTIEMGDEWCIYTSGGPDDIVTLQYQEDAKGDFDLIGVGGSTLDTTTLGVPMYSEQDTNGVYFLDGTTQWEVRVGNAGNGADPVKYAAAITIAQKLLG